MIKPYDATGPFEDEETVCFHWRLQDIMNAVMDSGMRLEHLQEMFDEKDYERPFWLKTEDIINGISVTKEEVDKMYDWRENPRMGLPNWFCLVGRKASDGILSRLQKNGTLRSAEKTETEVDSRGFLCYTIKVLQCGAVTH